MGVNFDNTIGRRLRDVSTKTDTKKPDPAMFWLNIGYNQEVDVEDGGTEIRFISLASGIALDTLTDLPTNGSNELFRRMQAARNDLRDQLLDNCKLLKPGQEMVSEPNEWGLQFQLRRVNDVKAEIKPSENPFTKRLSFAAAA